jgi:hypothetical protein
MSEMSTKDNKYNFDDMGHYVCNYDDMGKRWQFHIMLHLNLMLSFKITKTSWIRKHTINSRQTWSSTCAKIIQSYTILINVDSFCVLHSIVICVLHSIVICVLHIDRIVFEQHRHAQILINMDYLWSKNNLPLGANRDWQNSKGNDQQAQMSIDKDDVSDSVFLKKGWNQLAATCMNSHHTTLGNNLESHNISTQSGNLNSAHT